MDILKRIQRYAEEAADTAAIRSGGLTLTYKELWEKSGRLAAWLEGQEGKRKAPVAVYGHKDPWMLVCFLACVRSGRAYCPVDISVPMVRTEMILQNLDSGVIFSTEEFGGNAGEKQVVTKDMLEQIMLMDEYDGGIAPDQAVQGDETYYIIFTSGSTGMPKGVQISADCLNHYLDWSVGLGTKETEKYGSVFLNQAPFSFDLSVMDLYTCLACRGTLFCLEKTLQTDYKALMAALKESKANVWVSTPSFAEVCLSDPSFSRELMPELSLFLFCGEALGNRTVRKLRERFLGAVVMNTYGPTESTVAVTEVEVTEQALEQWNPLPVGKAKPGTFLEIWDEEGNVLPDGENGEIIILGDTVSTGYFEQPDLTKKAFFEKERDGKIMRGYHTGDKGYLKEGMLFYCGRIDLQIKLHGYRIELEDIENNVRRLPGIRHAVVLPNIRGEKVKSLTAYVTASGYSGDEKEENRKMRQALQEFLPDYMIPKKFVFLEQMPMTENGKADRKRLGGNMA